MTVEQIISKINNKTYYSLDKAVKGIGLHKKDLVASNLNNRTIPSCSIRTDVYKCDNGFIGLRGLYGDKRKKGYVVYNTPTSVLEFQAVKKVTYIPKLA